MSIQFSKPSWCYLYLPYYVPPSDQYRAWAVLYLIDRFSKPVEYCLSSDECICRLRVGPGVDTQLHEILFLQLALLHNFLRAFQLWGTPLPCLLARKLRLWITYPAVYSQIKWWEDWEGEGKMMGILPSLLAQNFRHLQPFLLLAQPLLPLLPLWVGLGAGRRGWKPTKQATPPP